MKIKISASLGFAHQNEEFINVGDDLIEQAEALLGRYQALTEHAKITPNAVILERIDIREAIIGMMPQLVEEIKRLEDFRKNVVGHFDCIVNQRDDLQEQLAAWQKIAIEEYAKFLFYLQYDDDPDPRISWHKEKAERPEFVSKYYDQAAKELNLQVTQEAGYLERLERLALSLCMDAGWDQEDFEAALEKIRRG